MSATSRAAPLPRQPVTAADEQVGLNGAIAAALTRAVGSMPALYVVLVVFAGWMALATWGPLHRVDPYPFAFLLFLDNVAQLVLCLVILVGQRVLGAFADRRAVQTYESAEAIFSQIADIQAHLDRHDLALGQGMSLLESSAHPWIERHRVRQPPQALDHAVGVNGRIAAWLTERLGSMWAFYIAAATQVLWTGLAAVGVQRFDPYPFAFMSFLSTLAQLVFMIVIMVGQGVLERAADRRSEQTFLDTEAILHECRRMKARLTAQDRLIESLADYTSGDITERLAQALHDRDVRLAAATGSGTGLKARLGAAVRGEQPPRSWAELPPDVKARTRVRARRVGELLTEVGCLLVPVFDSTLAFTFSDEEARTLARAEHEQRRSESAPGGAPPGAEPWDQLPAPEQERAIQLARSLPELLSGVGVQVVRDTRGHDGVGESDFTPQEWAILHRAMMATGVLVGLAIGSVDPEEMFALVKTLRDASITHRRRLIREAAATCTFETGLRADTRYADYAGPALATIRQAAAIVAGRAADELPSFQAFLVEIGTAVANANKEGGILGIGAHYNTDEEAAAVEAVRRAAEYTG